MTTFNVFSFIDIRPWYVLLVATGIYTTVTKETYQNISWFLCMCVVRKRKKMLDVNILNIILATFLASPAPAKDIIQLIWHPILLMSFYMPYLYRFAYKRTRVWSITPILNLERILSDSSTSCSILQSNLDTYEDQMARHWEQVLWAS